MGRPASSFQEAGTVHLTPAAVPSSARAAAAQAMKPSENAFTRFMEPLPNEEKNTASALYGKFLWRGAMKISIQEQALVATRRPKPPSLPLAARGGPAAEGENRAAAPVARA